jgi:hypothetical protein
MSFSEAVKKQVRQKAAFRCCRCEKVGVDVHHIIPEKNGGSDDIENAAPLCPNCHHDFGDNPEKRKAIFEMRDWWYKVAAARYPTEIISSQIGQEKLEKISKQLDALPKGLSDIEEIKRELQELSNRFIERAVTSANATRAASGIIDTIVSSTAPPEAYTTGHLGYIGWPFGTVICRRCEKEVLAGNYCPNCGNRFD